MEPGNKLAGKRKSFTVEQKVKFIKLIESREQQQVDMAKTFNVKPSTLSKIYKDRERILDE
jgi:transposase-like protein